jgi:drug/metabolite transporter (DMT)-like permease
MHDLYCMARAMKYAEISMIVTLDFLRLPFTATVGVLLHSEQLDVALVVGALVILLGNVIGVYGASKLKVPATNSGEVKTSSNQGNKGLK